MRLIILLIVVTMSYAQQPDHVRLEDNSDWWSIGKDDNPGTEPQKKLLDDADLTIAGIRLGKDDAPKKFGPARTVERGDAGSYRGQICYKSLSDGTFLIFEEGEVDSAAYLFESGKRWNGQDKCSASKLVSRQVSTAHGIKLGSSVDD